MSVLQLFASSIIRSILADKHHSVIWGLVRDPFTTSVSHLFYNMQGKGILFLDTTQYGSSDALCSATVSVTIESFWL